MKCNNCGSVHKHMPFVHCFSGTEAELPDSLADGYALRFGGDEQ